MQRSVNRRRAAFVALVAAAGLVATLLANPADAKPAKHRGPNPTATPTGTATSTPKPRPKPSPTPTIPDLPSSTPTPPPTKYCDKYDPTAPGQCILRAKVYTETISYTDARGHPTTAKVPAIRPLTLIDVDTGPGGKTKKRVSVPSVCAYYQIYTGQRLATYPAPDIFRASRPPSYWIGNATNNDFRTHYFIQMQLPNGIGKVEAPHSNFYTKKTHMGLTETYDDWIHLAYYKPKAYEDAYRHRNDNVGYWWDYQCSFARYRNITGTSTPVWLRNTLNRLHDDNPYWWEYWQPGQENPPEVPKPSIPITDLLKLVVPKLDLSSKPPYGKGIAQLPQFLWVHDEIGRYPITVHVGDQWATATPGPVSVSGLPASASKDLTCTNGGNPNPYHQSDSDCWLKFGQTTPKGQPLQLKFTQTWTVTDYRHPKAGPDGTITKSATHNFTIQEVQATGGH